MLGEGSNEALLTLAEGVRQPDGKWLTKVQIFN
jgi:hypothetical protein